MRKYPLERVLKAFGAPVIDEDTPEESTTWESLADVRRVVRSILARENIDGRFDAPETATIADEEDGRDWDRELA